MTFNQLLISVGMSQQFDVCQCDWGQLSRRALVTAVATHASAVSSSVSKTSVLRTH